MRPQALEIRDLEKTFPPAFKALRGVSLSIASGEFFGLLGPNGAGKTTLIQSLVGLTKPERGEIYVFGQRLTPQRPQIRQVIGLAPQEVNIDRFFNVRRTLEFQGGFYGFSRPVIRQRVEELLSRFRLEDKAGVQFYKLSGGMQRRLLIARALMTYPKILILDEPSAGVDVELRTELWEYLKGLNRDGTTLLLTTHYIEEAEALCERVGIIDHGNLIECGSPRDLINKHCEREVIIELSQPPPAELNQTLAAGFQIQGNLVIGKGVSVRFAVQSLLKQLMHHGCVIQDVKVKEGSLEEVFLKLVRD